MRVPPLVFWDFDGTLAQRPGLWAQALVDAWRACGGGPELSAECVRPHLRDGFPWHTPDIVRGPSSADGWWDGIQPVLTDALRQAGAGDVAAMRAAREVRREFYRPDAWSVVDGAREALMLVADSGFRNVILSNHPPELPGSVGALGLSPWVERTITSGTLGIEKPNPAFFAHAFEICDVREPAECWMVGDDPIADVEGGLRAGLRAILADGAYPDARGVTVLTAARSIVGAP